MKINIAHAAVAVAVLGLVYLMGKKRAEQASATTAQTSVQSEADWYTYANWNSQ